MRRLPPTDVETVLYASPIGWSSPLVEVAPTDFDFDPTLNPAAETADAEQSFKRQETQDDDGLLERVMPRPAYAVELGHSVVDDYVNFYATDNLTVLAAAFGAGAVVANTSADRRLRDGLHENLVRTPSDEYAEFLHQHRYLGDGFFLVPVYATVAVVGQGLGEDPLLPVVGEWGERSLRGILVGAPPLLTAQYITGGSRPGEEPWASDWRPFHDVNGVSGHAFMGSMPLISAAKMSDALLLKAAFYTASLLPGMSRITDDAHYPSQVILGWVLSYVAATAVDQTQRGSHDWQLFPWTTADAVGVGAEINR